MSQRYPINSIKKTHEVTLRKPHSPKQEELIFGEGNIVALCGRQFGKCIASGQMVYMADGTRRAVELMQPGDMVLSVNMDTYKIEARPVVAVLDNGIRDTIELRTRQNTLVCTPNHPLLAGEEWKQAGDLREGDLIGIAATGVFGENEIPDYELDLLAIWLAEGSGLAISNGDEEILSVVRDGLKALDPTLEFRYNSGVDWHIVCGKRSGGNEHKVVSAFSAMIIRYGLWKCNSHTKFVPPVIFGLNKKQIARFLNLFFSCDGCISLRTTAKGYRVFAIEVGLANERLVRDITFLLSKFGIQGTVRYKKHKQKDRYGKNYESWSFLAADYVSTVAFCHEIGMVSKMDRVVLAAEQAETVVSGIKTWLPIAYNTFIERMKYEPVERTEMRGAWQTQDPFMPDVLRSDLRAWRKQSSHRLTKYRFQKIREFSDGSFDKLSDGQVRWEEIASSIPSGKQQTWDLQVEGNHNFVVDGFIVHNTDAGVNRIFVNAIKHPGSLLWWVGLAWTAASLLRAEGEIYRISSEIITAAGQRPEDYINRTKHQVDLPNGSRIWLRTAERPESLAGEGIHGVVIDEFTLMNEEVWSMYLTQTLMFYSGWALFVGVPRGNNWGARLWRQAQSFPGWRALTATTYENPFMPKAQIESRKRELTERMYRQEIMAEIIDDAGAVFRDVSEAATALPQEYGIEGHVYVGGVDIARNNDYSVVTIIDVSLSEVCYMGRFNQLGLEFQEERILSICDRFSPSTLVVEETGIGMQMAERLGTRGQNVRAFKTGSTSKDVIIMALSAAIEKKELKLLPFEHPVGKIAIGELQQYEGRQGANGNWVYAAPSNSHDDCVMSIAFALHGMTGRKPPPDVVPLSFTRESTWR